LALRRRPGTRTNSCMPSASAHAVEAFDANSQHFVARSLPPVEGG
jgi:hypothetical protein